MFPFYFINNISLSVNSLISVVPMPLPIVFPSSYRPFFTLTLTLTLPLSPPLCPQSIKLINSNPYLIKPYLVHPRYCGDGAQSRLSHPSPCTLASLAFSPLFLAPLISGILVPLWSKCSNANCRYRHSCTNPSLQLSFLGLKSSQTLSFILRFKCISDSYTPL